MRLVVLLLAALSVVGSAVGQDNSTDTNTTSTDANASTSDANATPEPAGPITIVLLGHADGGKTYFTDESGKPNPTLSVQPGQSVTFKFKSVTGVHNLHLSTGEKTALVSDGEEVELSWTAPADAGKLEYWCDPHKGSGMKGSITVGSSAPAGGEGGESTISGDTIDLGTYDAACAGKLAPAIATQEVTGMPTLPDYIQACKQGTNTEKPARATHVVDYVIPVSWLLIGLGIVGVVWVHKYYKP